MYRDEGRASLRPVPSGREGARPSAAAEPDPCPELQERSGDARNAASTATSLREPARAITHLAHLEGSLAQPECSVAT